MHFDSFLGVSVRFKSNPVMNFFQNFSLRMKGDATIANSGQSINWMRKHEYIVHLAIFFNSLSEQATSKGPKN